ncbi:MAG: EAL domain-containing protein [Syntrophobacteraceae bacterium]
MKKDGNPTYKTVVLVVDADPASRMQTCDLIERCGCLAETAQDGVQAIEIFKKIEPDVVILYAELPGMNGYALCAEIRRISQGKHTKILMITGPGEADARSSYEAGASDFIAEPATAFSHRVMHILRDVCSQEELHRTQDMHRATVDASPHLLLRIGQDGTILDRRSPAGFNFGCFADALPGCRIGEILFREAPGAADRYIEQVLHTGRAEALEFQFKQGSETYSYETLFMAGKRNEILAVVRDVTTKKRAYEKMVRLAYYDALTGLLNRHSFEELLERALAQSNGSGNISALLHVDLDNFKRINNTFGRSAGDALLQRTADRIVQFARKSDCTAGFGHDFSEKAVARVGGDEFLILLPRISQIRDAAVVAKRLLDDISRPLVLVDHELFVSASIGIAIYPSDGNEPGTLLKNAEEAMNRAKENGRSNLQFYTASDQGRTRIRLDLERDLRRVLDRGELLVHYQPQVDLRTGRIVGAEALLRWEHPEKGLISPAEFIPLAEETGLIVPIGRWVLAVACMQNTIWVKSGFRPIRIAVNLSSHQFRQKNIVETVGKVLRNSALDPNSLELEITEGTIMQDAESTIHLLKKFKNMGLRLAVDDFGTGYSSLNYLKRFPLDVLKIDRSFIKDLMTDSDDAVITKAIIAMAHSLNLEVIAEGIETEEQLSFLRENKCDAFQGYYFSRPVSATVMTKLLEEGKSLRLE